MYMHMSICLWLFVQNELYAMYADGCASPTSLPTVCRKKCFICEYQLDFILSFVSLKVNYDK